MTKNELKEAVAIAKSGRDLSVVDDSTLCGCGLRGFQPVTVTVEMVAKFIRWHCLLLNGELDAGELNELAGILRRTATVL